MPGGLKTFKHRDTRISAYHLQLVVYRYVHRF